MCGFSLKDPKVGKKDQLHYTAKAMLLTLALGLPTLIDQPGGLHNNICIMTIKGLVHPKMKMKSLITDPHAEPTP